MDRCRNISEIFRHAICVAALMWTAIINGQAFLFSDSTNYIRAADMALHIASGRTFSTEWTKRPQQELKGATQKEPTATPPSARHNDLKHGMIMAGRSPYFGALMYGGYLTSNFWAFLALQSLIAYILIILSLNRFGVGSSGNILAVVVALAATTTLPYYNSLLMPDAFFSFGILSFVLLCTPGKLSSGQVWFLSLVLVTSAVAHVHSLAVIAGLVLTLVVCWLVGWQAKIPRRGLIAAILAVIIGLASVQVTALATEAAFGKKPQFVPVLTARVIADGPGMAFIQSGCEGDRFQICRVHIGEPRNAGAILSGTTYESGAYLLASPSERKRMGLEDRAFALAVMTTYPAWQSSKIIRNTVQQLLWIEYDGLNTGCFDAAQCWNSLPPNVRKDLRVSASGQSAWPASLMNLVLCAVVLLSVIALTILWPTLWKTSPRMARWLRMWIILIVAGMLGNAILGGAGVEPQYRYQGRLIWLLPLLASILVLLRLRGARPKGEL